MAAGSFGKLRYAAQPAHILIYSCDQRACCVPGYPLRHFAGRVGRGARCRAPRLPGLRCERRLRAHGAHGWRPVVRGHFTTPSPEARHRGDHRAHGKALRPRPPHPTATTTGSAPLRSPFLTDLAPRDAYDPRRRDSGAAAFSPPPRLRPSRRAHRPNRYPRAAGGRRPSEVARRSAIPRPGHSVADP